MITLVAYQKVTTRTCLNITNVNSYFQTPKKQFPSIFVAFLQNLWTARCESNWIIEWFGLESTLKITYFQPPAMGDTFH